MQRLLGGIEAGGTKFVCVVGRADGDIVERARFDTRAPEATLAEVLEFFRAANARHGSLEAYGIASFGPLDLDRRSPTFGSITRTPKPQWSGVSLTQPLRAAFSGP